MRLKTTPEQTIVQVFEGAKDDGPRRISVGPTKETIAHLHVQPSLDLAKFDAEYFRKTSLISCKLNRQ